jgi:hypothetical protein
MTDHERVRELLNAGGVPALNAYLKCMGSAPQSSDPPPASDGLSGMTVILALVVSWSAATWMWW